MAHPLAPWPRPNEPSRHCCRPAMPSARRPNPENVPGRRWCRDQASPQQQPQPRVNFTSPQPAGAVHEGWGDRGRGMDVRGGLRSTPGPPPYPPQRGAARRTARGVLCCCTRVAGWAAKGHSSLCACPTPQVAPGAPIPPPDAPNSRQVAPHPPRGTHLGAEGLGSGASLPSLMAADADGVLGCTPRGVGASAAGGGRHWARAARRSAVASDWHPAEQPAGRGGGRRARAQQQHWTAEREGRSLVLYGGARNSGFGFGPRADGITAYRQHDDMPQPNGAAALKEREFWIAAFLLYSSRRLWQDWGAPAVALRATRRCRASRAARGAQAHAAAPSGGAPRWRARGDGGRGCAAQGQTRARAKVSRKCFVATRRHLATRCPALRCRAASYKSELVSTHRRVHIHCGALWARAAHSAAHVKALGALGHTAWLCVARGGRHATRPRRLRADPRGCGGAHPSSEHLSTSHEAASACWLSFSHSDRASLRRRRAPAPP